MTWCWWVAWVLAAGMWGVQAAYLSLIPLWLEVSLGHPCVSRVTLVTQDGITVLEQVSLASGKYLSRAVAGQRAGALQAFDGRDYFHYPGHGQPLLVVTGLPPGLAHDDRGQLGRWARRRVLEGTGRLTWGWRRGPALVWRGLDLTVYLHPLHLRPMRARAPVETMDFQYLPWHGWQLALPPGVEMVRVPSDLGPWARDEVLRGAGLAVRWPRHWPPGLAVDQLFVCRAPAGTVVVLNFSGAEAVTVIQSRLTGPGPAGDTRDDLVEQAKGEDVLVTWKAGAFLITVQGRAGWDGLPAFIAGLR
jgi:hypothetical protein